MINKARDTSITMAYLMKENEELNKEIDELKKKTIERDHCYDKLAQLHI